MRFKAETFERALVYGSLFIPFGLLFKIVPREVWGLCLMFSVLAFFLERKNFFFPRLFINLSGIVFITLFFLTVNLSNFLENSLRTLLFLLSLKLLEKKGLRDYFQIYLLEFLILAGASYFYTHISFFLLLLLQIFHTGYALYFHLYLAESEARVLHLREIRGGLLWFGALLCLSLMLSAIFFVSLPRLKVPLFNLAPAKEEKARTGFTDKIRLGTFSEIQESSRRVLRLVFEEGRPIYPESLYFRVMVYDYFDGRTWQRREGLKETLPDKNPFGKVLKGLIYLEQDMEGYLPVPEDTEAVKGIDGVRAFADRVFRLETPHLYPLRYEVLLRRGADSTSEVEELSPYLQVPEIEERVIELARRLKGKDEEETLRKILSYFQQEGFRYSLTRLPLTQRPMESFLFETKRGNCEYFAGATALLLRLNGIPARVIGGFRGAIYQERGGYYLVEERFAHSWVETWIKGKWLRIDPSPSASFLLFRKKQGLTERLRLYLDWINFYYTRFILDFDISKQKRLFSLFKGEVQRASKEGAKELTLQVLKERLKTGAFILLFMGILVVFLRYRRELAWFTPVEKRFLHSLFKELKKRGYEREKSEGLFELAEKIKDATLREEVLRFVILYTEYSYKDRAFDKEALKRLRECLKRLQGLR